MSAKFVKLSSKNQLTLPKDVLKHFPKTRYFEITARESEVVLRPARISVQGDALKRVRDKINKLGLTEDVIPDAITSARFHNK